MSKKSLSDLLREEVHRKPESEVSSEIQKTGAQSSEAKASAAKPKSAVSKSTARANEATKTKVASKAEASSKAVATPKVKEVSKVPSRKPVSSSRLTKAELEGKVTNLTEALTKAEKDVQQQETEFNKTLAKLEAQMAKQAQSIQSLQDELGQTQAMKTELALAKKDALKLAQENERLQAQIQNLTAKGDVSMIEDAGSKDLSRREPRRESRPSVKDSATRSQPAPRSIFERPIRRAPSPTQTGKPSKNFDTWCYD